MYDGNAEIDRHSDPLARIAGKTPRGEGGSTRVEYTGYTIPFPIAGDRALAQAAEYGEKQAEDYRDFKHHLCAWLLQVGKRPEKREGLAETTVRGTSYKIDTVMRWLWATEGRYTTRLTPDRADDYMDVTVEHSGNSDSTLLDYAKSIQRYFLFRSNTTSDDFEWECRHELSQEPTGERDFLDSGFFYPLYEAALAYQSIKSYHTDMSPSERDQLAGFIAQVVGVPKEHVGPEEWAEVNTWKYASLIGVTLDTGLRPVEVERARTAWFNPGERRMRVPKEESTKNTEYWNCALSSRTAKAVSRWLDERKRYDMYAETDAMWLTKYGSNYKSNSCNSILRRIMDGSETDFPDITWYNIRHGVATAWANDVGLMDAKEQLRQKSIRTTLKYVHSTPSRRGKMADSVW